MKRNPQGGTIVERLRISSHAHTCLSCEKRQAGWFCDLPQAALADYDAKSSHLMMPSGSTLFSEGDAPRGVSVLCRGHIKLTKVSSDGRTFLVRVAGPGDVVGLSAALSRTPYEVTAQALEGVQMKTFRRGDFLKFLKHHAEGGLKAADSLNSEYRAALTDACRLALSGSIAGRIAHFLVQSAIEAGTETDPQPVVRMPLTHEDLAAKLGSSRESITRALNNLKRKGVITVSGDQITILRKYALESIL